MVSGSLEERSWVVVGPGSQQPWCIWGKQGLWEDGGHSRLFLPCSAGAGREDKCREGRAEVLAETPARPGAGAAADRAHPQKGETQEGAGEQAPSQALSRSLSSLWHLWC